MKRLLALVVFAVPGQAQAHAFSSGADAYGAFLEGAKVILTTPSLILPLAALGLMLALWKTEGMLAAWPAFLVGQIIGLLIAPFFPPAISLVPLGIGLVIGIIAALVPLARLAGAIPILAGLLGVAIMAAALEGHGFTEIGVAIRFGLLVAANVVTALVAGLGRLVLTRWTGDVPRISLRVAVSWVSAILVLYLAFAMRP